MATVKMVALVQYIASKAGATGLTVTCDVDEYNIDAATVNNAFLTAQSMTAVRNGIYRLFFDGDDTKLYTATAKTADSSVDQQHIAAVIVRLDRVNNADVLTSTRNATTPPTAASVADAIWDEALSGHATAGSSGATLSAAGSSADPLLNAVPGSYASGTAGAALGKVAAISSAALYSPAVRSNEFTLANAIQGALRPTQLITWLTGDGVALVLTGATITGVIRNRTNNVARAVAGTLAVTDGAAGTFTWTYAAADVADAGTFDVQFSAAFGSAPTPARTFVATWVVEEALAVKA
jgi:hypothetical protein